MTDTAASYPEFAIWAASTVSLIAVGVYIAAKLIRGMLLRSEHAMELCAHRKCVRCGTVVTLEQDTSCCYYVRVRTPAPNSGSDIAVKSKSFREAAAKFSDAARCSCSQMTSERTP